MKNYTVVIEREDLEGLMKTVNEMLAKGYMLIGGISVTLGSNETYLIYAQALAYPT